MSARLPLPSTTVVSVLAALATWLTMTTWSGFSEEPWGYLGPLAVACAIVALSGALLRAARLHPILVVLGQVALLALWLNHRLAPDPSLLGWIPTAQSIRESVEALGASVDTAKAYAAPVPRSVPDFPPILIVTGAYLAVLVDLLACGLRRVPLAGLPLLAMYTAPVSMLGSGVTWWKFALLALAFLALLAGEEATRLAHWGRDLGHEPGTSQPRWTNATSQTVWPSARKIGATATALAVVVPVLIPTISGGILAGTGGGSGDGDGGVNIDNPMLNMQRDLVRLGDVPTLQVTTDDPAPEYLRLAVLDVYKATSWTPSDRDIPVDNRVDGELPPPAGLDSDVSATSYVSQFVADDEYESFWLPAPYPLLDVDVSGDWRLDPSTLDIVSAAEDKTAAGLRWETVGLDVDPTAQDLTSAGAVPAELFRRYTELDGEALEWIESLADDVTAEGDNKAEKAALLQDWFAQPHEDDETDPSFSYDLSRSGIGSGIDDLRDFLEVSRTGYCEQFAGAMALMARTLDIPARVAVGYLRPDRVGATGSGTWVYSSHDLHAWPELYFEGVGWTLFEPTPSTRLGATAPPYTAGLRPVDNPTASPSAPSPSASVSPSTRPSQSPNLPDEPVGGAVDLDGSGPPWFRIGLGVVPLVLLLASVPRLLRSVIRRRRWAAARTPAEQAEAAWAELRDSMIDLRMPWDDRVTVRQRAKDIVPLFRRRPGKGEEHLARIITNNPEAQAALERILLLVERARYARTAPEVEDVRSDVATCVESLKVGVERNVRRKADWLPASLVNRSRRHSTKAGPGLATLAEPSLDR